MTQTDPVVLGNKCALLRSCSGGKTLAKIYLDAQVCMMLSPGECVDAKFEILSNIIFYLYVLMSYECKSLGMDTCRALIIENIKYWRNRFSVAADGQQFETKLCERLRVYDREFVMPALNFARIPMVSWASRVIDGYLSDMFRLNLVSYLLPVRMGCSQEIKSVLCEPEYERPTQIFKYLKTLTLDVAIMDLESIIRHPNLLSEYYSLISRGMVIFLKEYKHRMSISQSSLITSDTIILPVFKMSIVERLQMALLTGASMESIDPDMFVSFSQFGSDSPTGLPKNTERVFMRGMLEMFHAIHHMLMFDSELTDLCVKTSLASMYNVFSQKFAIVCKHDSEINTAMLKIKNTMDEITITSSRYSISKMWIFLKQLYTDTLAMCELFKSIPIDMSLGYDQTIIINSQIKVSSSLTQLDNTNLEPLTNLPRNG
jgi:hypothetical protein